MRKSLTGLALFGILALTATTAVAEPVPGTDNTSRLAGPDRWGTAAEISQEYWEPEFTTHVFLASGDVFPDALTIGPSQFFRGPLLLTHGPDETWPNGDLDDDTRAELDRLDPCEVVAAGGPVRIPDEVLQEADTYTLPETDPKCAETITALPERLHALGEKIQSQSTE